MTSGHSENYTTLTDATESLRYIAFRSTMSPVEKATQQQKNTACLLATRRDIARAKTILAEKRAAGTAAK